MATKYLVSGTKQPSEGLAYKVNRVNLSSLKLEQAASSIKRDMFKGRDSTFQNGECSLVDYLAADRHQTGLAI